MTVDPSRPATGDLHERWDGVSGVGRTALAAAAARATETRRPGGLISDPFAEAFVRVLEPDAPLLTGLDEPAAGSADAGFRRMVSLHLGTRTRYFDEYLTGACDAGVRQVVVLATGLDARALRMAWPTGTVLFEIDQPIVLAVKRDVLDGIGAEPRCDRREVPVDLREDWPAALTAAGFDDTRPTAWLAEGLLPYLPADSEEALLGAVTELSAPGSRIAIEDIVWTSVWPTATQDLMTDSAGADVHGMFAIDDRPRPSERLHTLGWTTRAELAERVAARWGEPALGRLVERFETPSVEFVTASLPGPEPGAGSRQRSRPRRTGTRSATPVVDSRSEHGP